MREYMHPGTWFRCTTVYSIQVLYNTVYITILYIYDIITTCYLNFLVSEGEEESLAVLGTKTIDAPGVDGPGQVVVDILLRVPLVLVPPRPDAQPEHNRVKGTVSRDFDHFLAFKIRTGPDMKRLNSFSNFFVFA